MTCVFPGSAVRRWLTDPLPAAVLLCIAGGALAGYGAQLTWAILGGLAGYSLSGSV